MKVFVFGNPDLKEDSLPLMILPELRKKLPDIDFVTLDPNEEWDMPDDVLVIDTVLGIDGVKIIDGLDKFAVTPNLTMHDFDALSNLRYLKKLGKIKNIKIIGVAPFSLKERTIDEMVTILTKRLT